MFHIVLNSDENYIKYAAVLITSIVKSTDLSKKFIDFVESAVDSATKSSEDSSIKTSKDSSTESNSAECKTSNFRSTPPRLRLEDLKDSSEGYHFHILIDSILDSTQDKLSQLANELSKIYPCKIEIHTISNDLFKDFNAWGFEEKQNYSAYYRLCLERFMPKDLDKCLYLDVDMLVVADVRELFAIDLGDKILGAAANSYNIKVFYPSLVIKAKDSSKNININSLKNEFYNSGSLMINLSKWREKHIEEKCLRLCSSYRLRLNDQDALNIATNGENVFFGYKWNVAINQILGGRYEVNANNITDINVYHYAYVTKPWMGVNKSFYMLVSNNIGFKDLYKYHEPWWKIAKQTPMFCEELMELRENLNTNAVFDLMKIMQEQYLKQQAQIYKLDRRLSRILNPHKAIIKAVRKIFRKKPMN